MYTELELEHQTPSVEGRRKEGQAGPLASLNLLVSKNSLQAGEGPLG